MESAKALSDQFSATMGLMAQKAIKESKKKAQEHIKELISDTEKSLNDLWLNLPVLEVKIGEQETKKLKTRAHPQLERMIINSKLGLYSMLVGPAGCGKTTAAMQLADALDLQFGSVCLTAGASETWLFGRQTPTGFIEGPFSKMYREGGVFLADEMDAADANLLLAMNTALSHDIMLNPMNGETIRRHKDFNFVAAANTNGKGASHLYTDRSRLDAATLDRFIILTVDYDQELERALCPEATLCAFLHRTRKQMLNEGHDDFLSTRAFVNSYKQFKAGVPIKDIVNTLSANWDDGAKETIDRVFNRFDWLPEKSETNPYKREATGRHNVRTSINGVSEKIPF